MAMDMASMNEVMIYKIMYDQFMNQVQVIQNLYAKYDPDTLALLDDMEPDKRYRFLNNIKEAYVKVSLEILATENLIERNDARIVRFTEKGDPEGAKKWINVNQYPKEWLKDNEALLIQAKSQYAMCRSLALVQAFEQKKKRGGILGTTKDIIASMKQGVGHHKSKQKGKGGVMSAEDRQKATDAGLDPDKVLKSEGG